MHPWPLSCPQCETHLRKDPAWSTTISEIVETYDEKLEREDWEKRGTHDLRFVEAIASAKNAGMEIPVSLSRALQNSTGARLFAVAGKLVCANGHDCEPGSKFCADCGASMREPQVHKCPDGHPVEATSKFCPECGSPILRAAAAQLEPPAAPEAAGEIEELRAALKAFTEPKDGPAPQNGARKKPLKDWRAEDLKALAREKGLDDSGTRTDVLARLREAA